MIFIRSSSGGSRGEIQIKVKEAISISDFFERMSIANVDTVTSFSASQGYAVR